MDFGQFGGFGIQEEEAPPPPMPKKEFAWELESAENLAVQPNTLRNPADVAFLDETHMVVADSEGHCLQIWDIMGKLKNTIAQDVVWPNCVDVTKEGHIVVTDRKKRSVR